jgi:hypothetical protein
VTLLDKLSWDGAAEGFRCGDQSVIQEWTSLLRRMPHQ